MVTRHFWLARRLEALDRVAQKRAQADERLLWVLLALLTLAPEIIWVGRKLLATK